MNKIEKEIKALEEQRTKELKIREQIFEKELAALLPKNQDNRKLKRLRGKKPEEQKVDDIKEWSLVNLDSLKEFIKYGSNKVLDQIRIRNQANVIAREEIEKMKKKESIDMKQAGLTLVILAIFAVMAYVVVINFMDYSTLTKDLNAEKVKVGTVSGQLAACQSELAQYKPQGARPITAAPVEGQTQGNTLEG